MVELPEKLGPAGVVGRVYGQPVETASGATVIPVARVRGAVASPVGVYVVRGDQAKWVPAVDGDRLALIGVLTGLVSAVLASIAVLRRPPWPDLHGWPPARGSGAQSS